MRTAPGSNEPSGSAEITHPFHPLLGKRFSVLKSRRVSGIERLTLRGTSGGTINVPKDWTDWGAPGTDGALGLPGQILDFRCLLVLAELIQEIERSSGEGSCE